MNRFITFLKNWMLPIGMITGALLYIVYHYVPFFAPAGPFLLHAVKKVQPLLLFLMLFLTFTRISPKDMRMHRWQWWLLMIQACSFVALSVMIILCPWLSDTAKGIIEAAMICLICPTATAASVVTGKLGGDMAGLITYTVMINLVTAVVVPLFVPAIHPAEGVTFFSSFLKIMAKVFPMLICPCVVAWGLRYLFPGVHALIQKYSHWSFYIWGVALTLAILMTTRAIFNNDNGAGIIIGIGVASLLCCAFEFWAGKEIGAMYGERITVGQSLGQKNTVFAIWMGYTFLSPVTSVAGGLYSIWQNCFNSWQLYRRRKLDEQGVPMPHETR